MRHGIAAEPPEFAGPDRLRPLTEEGRRRTAAVAKSLVAFMPPTLIVSSDLVRAVQTAELVNEAVTSKIGQGPIVHLRSISLRPESSFDDWRLFVSAELSTHIEPTDSVLVVGHQPTISEFFCRHLGFSQETIAFKKAAVGIFEPITMERAHLIGFFPPRSWRD